MPYQVPFVSTEFGRCLDTGHTKDQLVIILYRGVGGWRTPEDKPHALLPHQVYEEDLRPIFDFRTAEVVVVGLQTGLWVTIWAQSAQDVTHPPRKQGA